MSFKKWLKEWILAFINLLTLDNIRYKSKVRREKRRLHHSRATRSSVRRHRKNKKYRRRRSSISVQNERVISSLFTFFSATIAIILLPLGLLDFGLKSVKAHSDSKKSQSYTKASGLAPKANIATSREVATTAKRSETKTTNESGDAKNPVSRIDSSGQGVTLFPREKTISDATRAEPIIAPDENTPKSTPKHSNDQYIRKRMTIAGSGYCNPDAFVDLKIGSRFDLELESDNQYDKDAVKLVFNGNKIGYVAKSDKSAFVTCLKLKHNIYGVITDIDNTTVQIKYEYETWFDYS